MSFKFITNDFWRKLTALTLACISWWVVSSQFQTNITLQDIPVHIEYNKQRYYIPIKDYDISLTVSRMWSQGKLTSDDFKLEIHVPENLNNPITLVKTLTPAQITSKPILTRIHHIQPEVINIPVDLIEQKIVDIRIPHKGQVSEKHEMTSITAVPHQVTIRGPSKIVRSISSIDTIPLYFSRENTQSFSTTLGLEPLEYTNLVSIMDLPEQEVRVDVVIVDPNQTDTLAFTCKVSHFLQSADSPVYPAKLPDKQVKFLLRGSKQSLNAFKEKDLVPYLDLTKILQEGVYQVPVRVTGLPLGLEIDKVEPESLELEMLLLDFGETAVPSSGAASTAKEKAGGAPAAAKEKAGGAPAKEKP